MRVRLRGPSVCVCVCGGAGVGGLFHVGGRPATLLQKRREKKGRTK